MRDFNKIDVKLLKNKGVFSAPFPKMEKEPKDRYRLFSSYFSTDGKVGKRSFPTVSATAQARTPQPSARPPHAASGRQSQQAKPRRGDILITPHVSVGETDTLTSSKPRRGDTHAAPRHTRPVAPKDYRQG